MGSHLAAPRVGGATSYSSGAPVMFSGGKRLEAFKRPAAACTDEEEDDDDGESQVKAL